MVTYPEQEQSLQDQIAEAERREREAGFQGATSSQLSLLRNEEIPPGRTEDQQVVIETTIRAEQSTSTSQL